MSENQTVAQYRELKSSVATLHELLEAMERTVIEQSVRLEDALAMAQGASRAKSEFLSTMSHEIRTPMNAVLGMADLLAETELVPEQLHYLDIMVANGNTLMDLINSILDLARIESGRLQLDHVQFDLIDLIERTISTFAVQAHRKGVELIARVAPGVPDHLVGDPLRLRQIIVNLVANAIKFTAGGEVVLEVEAIARTSAVSDVRFTVSDTGIGIASEQLDSLYASFTQGDSSVSRKYGGSGLGLAIVKRLVDLMRGQISVASEVGKGTRFSLSVPFGLPCSVLSPTPLAMPDLSGHRVLVVDDHRLNRVLAREIMAHCRAEITEAATIDEALIAIRNAVIIGKPYKLVLLDMRMSDGSGLDLVKRVRREQLPNASFIPMLYADDIRQQVAQFEEHRLDVYLVKPITRRGLFRAIGRKMARFEGVSPDERMKTLAAEPDFPLGGRRMRILVAEDSTDNRFVIEAYLRKEPCTLTFVQDGEQAVGMATSNDYDLIFMDIHMPNKDGLAATRTIRKWESEHGRKPVPIIALTASALREDVERSLLAGCNSHISKPVKKRVILEAIRDAAPRPPAHSLIMMQGEGFPSACAGYPKKQQEG